MTVLAAEWILRKSGIKMKLSFSQLWRLSRDLMRPFGGKYPAISSEIDCSMVNLSSDPSDTSVDEIDPETVNPNDPLICMDFDEMIAREMAQSSIAQDSPHSLFVEVDSDGHRTHKKSVLRNLFDMTRDSRSSTDWLQRIRGFTIGGKSWCHENSADTLVSSSTHFQLGNLFSTLVSKCTLIKNCVAPTKPVSMSAVPLAELNLVSSAIQISGQVLSLIPLTADASEWAWDGQFISFSWRASRKNHNNAGTADVARIPNLQIVVLGRLVDPVHKYAREMHVSAIDLNLGSERERTWVFSNADITASWNRLWISILKDKTLHDKFPAKFTGVSSGVFPYSAPQSPGNSLSLWSTLPSTQIS
ncbi:hypothetical protein B0H10DRAFT_1961297 [Mycena sp. CBHHK59/15]|nr:hypothetical protein B0H10DRAFT_1961297 [Mycena sp. CBHHK59/15]